MAAALMDDIALAVARLSAAASSMLALVASLRGDRDREQAVLPEVRARPRHDRLLLCEVALGWKPSVCGPAV
jgi:hypothetical protein